MQKILIGQVAEGMVLGRDIETQEGRVLCGKGAALENALIKRLKKMGITAITVEGRPLAVEGEKSLDQELKEIDLRFSKVQDIPPLVYMQKKMRERAKVNRG